MTVVRIFTGLPFRNNENLSDADKEAAFREYIESLSLEEQAAAYVKILGIPSEEQLNAAVNQMMSNNMIIP